MHIIVTLGKRWTETPTVIQIFSDDIGEINPDDVFHAANRIETEAEDIANLATSWQRQLRHTIETARAPSMSGGDTFELVSDAGRHLGGWYCESVGWSYIEPSVVA